MGRLEDGVWMTQDAFVTAKDGRFDRAPTRYRNWITEDGAPGPTGRGGFAAESGRYHLYVSLACPWAHRTLILRALKDLTPQITVDVVHPFMGADGWSFDADAPGATGDTLLGKRFLREVYLADDPKATGRVTVPVLWDRETAAIVSNESAEIIRMFNGAFDAVTGNVLDLRPPDLRDEIEAVNSRVYGGLNNGVYRAGFATTQGAYEAAVRDVFDTLDWLEARLAGQPYVAGDRVTEADWRLATTLFRFDPVYVGHFKCNLRRLVDYPELWGYARGLYQQPGVAGTVDFDHIRRHYYTSHETINPTRIVPAGPIIDWDAPPDRARTLAA